jgi:chemotaxis protein methyltransferase CheR
VVEADGFMVLGAAESVVGISDAFKPYSEKRGLYRPNAARTVKPGLMAVMAQPVKAVAQASR